MANCIEQSGIAKKDLLLDLGNDSLTQEQQLYKVNYIIDFLYEQKKSIYAQQKEAIKNLKAEEIAGTHAGRYTSRNEETDPGNELNLFEPVTYRKVINNALQKFKTIKEAITSKFQSTELTDNEATVLQDLERFTNGFGSAGLDEVFKNIQNADYRYKDFIQYFGLRDQDGNPIDLTLDQNLKDTISSVVYEFIATRLQEGIYNNPDQVARILGLKDTEAVTSDMMNALSDVGVNGTNLALTLGQKIFHRLGIQPTNDAQYNAKERAQKSLGLMAIAGMEHLNIIKKHNISNDAIQKLKQNTFVNPTDVKIVGSIIGKPTIDFYQTVSVLREVDGKKTQQLPERQAEIHKTYNKARHIIDQIFTTDTPYYEYSWEPHKYAPDYKFRLKNSNQYATQKQSQNLINSINKPYVNSKPITNLFFGLKEKFQDQIQGGVDPNFRHVSRKKGTISINQNVLNERLAVMDWLDIAKEREQTGESTEFFVPAEIWKMGRMGQTGSIQPQNSKFMRSIFAMKEWQVELTPGVDQDLDNSFLEAVAFALDIESNHVGGSENQIDKLNAKLQEPLMRKALGILSSHLNNPDVILSDDQMQTLADAASDINNGVHGLKGLLEYARFQKGQTFTTDLYKEIDGISNGPIIGLLQLMGFSAVPEDVLATLMSGGFEFAGIDSNIDEYLHGKNVLDAYERMGQSWAYALNERITQLKEQINNSDLEHSKRKFAQQNLDQLNAVTGIIGNFTDSNGILEKKLRKLSKPRTMQTIYGAGITSQIQRFVSNDIIESGIYDKLEDFAKTLTKPNLTKAERNNLISEINAFVLNVRVATQNPKFANNLTVKNLSPETLLNLTLHPKDIKTLHKHVTFNHGLAMKRAVQHTYGSIVDTKSPFNQAIRLTVAMYNNVFHAKVTQLIETNTDPNSDIKYKPTVQDITDIHESLQDIFPKVKTPFYDKETDTGYIDLASISKERDYEYSAKKDLDNKNNTATIQQYNKNNTKVQRKIAYTSKIQGLSDPGVAPIINLIFSIDSTVANKLLGSDLAALNNHDGFSTSINSDYALGQTVNNDFYNINKNFSIGKEINDTLQNILEKYNTYAQELGLENHDELTNIIIGNMRGFIDKSVRDNFGLEYDEKDKDSTILLDFIKKGNLTSKEIADFIIEKINNDVQSLSTITEQNKDTILAAVTKMMQYSQQGNGFVTGNSVVDEIFDIDPTTLNSLAQDSVINNANSIAEMIANNNEEYGSSPDINNVSTETIDYPDVRKINNMNLVEQFNQILDMDRSVSHATVGISDAHSQHLRHILSDIVQKVMTPAQVYIGEHTDDTLETMGKYTVDQSKIWIQKQKETTTPNSGMLAQGLRMSTAEVYTHEFIHHIIHSGLKDPRLRKQARLLFEQAKKDFKDKYGDEAWRVFLNDPYINVNDPANQFEVQAAKDRWNYLFEHKGNTYTVKDPLTGKEKTKKVTYALDEFIAFGLTNENFIHELSQIEISDKNLRIRNSLSDLIGNNLQETIVNFYNKVMDFINQKFYGQDHDTNMVKEIENLTLALGKLDSRKKTGLVKFISDMDIKFTVFGKAANKKITDTIGSNIYIRGIKGLEKIRQSDTVAGQGIRNIIGMYNDREYGLVQSIITELKGNTSRVAPLHELNHIRGIVLDIAKEHRAETIRKTVNNFFKNELTSRVKSAITKAGIKTDLSSLLAHNNITTIRDFVTNRNVREQRINDLEQRLQNNSTYTKYADYFQKAADDLAFFMITSRGRSNGVPMLNAHNIATLKNTKYEGELSPSEIQEVKGIIDQLTTLKSLNYVSQNDIQSLGQLMINDLSGMEKTFHQHNLLKEESLNKVFYNNPVLMMKGYTKAILNPRIQFEQGTIEDEAEFERKGYTRQENPLPRDPNDPDKDKDVYMYKSQLGMANDLATGTYSFTRNVAKGTSLLDVQRQISYYDDQQKRAISNNEVMVNAIKDRLDTMTSNKPRISTTAGFYNMAIPKFDRYGNIVEARYVMAESTKDNILEQHSEFDAILAGLAGQIVDKEQTPVINEQVINALYDLYDKDYDDNPEAYVSISPNSTEKRYRDIYNMLTPTSQKQIIHLWGTNSMEVPKDVIDLVFGGRKYTIAEMFQKDPKTRKTYEKIITETATFVLGLGKAGKAVQRAKTIEDLLRGITKLAKSNIVIRNLSVIIGNHTSNMAYLKSKGMTLEDILNYSRTAFTSGLQYQADKDKLEELKENYKIEERRRINPKTKQQRLKRLEEKILILEDNLTRNPSTDLIEAGLLPTIVDDVDTGGTQSPYIYGVEKALDTLVEKLPKPIANVGKVIFMAEDTQIYKVLNNSVKMTDYVARFALYQHYVKNEGKDSRKSIAAVNEEFVNFSLPSHKILEYASDIGVIWFAKYQLRVLKNIMYLLKDQPFTTLATWIITSPVGVGNVLNSIPGVTKDLFSAFGTPIDTLMGSIDDTFVIDAIDEPFT